MLLSLVFLSLSSIILCIKCNKFGDVLSAAIVDGSSLRVASVEELKPHVYNVEASGSVENFSKWPLKVLSSESAAGYISLFLRNIKPGQREIFGSHKVGDTAKGTWVRYTLLFDDDILIHLSYSVPYSHDLHINILAVGVCLKTSRICAGLDADKMYYGKYSFVDLHTYWQPAKNCFDNVCVYGTIDSRHHPDIRFYVYPKSFYDLSFDVQAELSLVEYDAKEEYEEFMKNHFGDIM